MLHSCLGFCEAVDEDGEDDVHHDEARQKGPRDEIGSDANLNTLVSDSQSLLISSLRDHFHTQIPLLEARKDSYSIRHTLKCIWYSSQDDENLRGT